MEKLSEAELKEALVSAQGYIDVLEGRIEEWTGDDIDFARALLHQTGRLEKALKNNRELKTYAGYTRPTEDKLEAMKRAYADYPSQDNEGYVPHRGGFKAGFYAAWSILEQRLENALLDNRHLQDLKTTYFGEISVLKDRIEKAEADCAQMRGALRQIAYCSCPILEHCKALEHIHAREALADVERIAGEIIK